MTSKPKKTKLENDEEEDTGLGEDPQLREPGMWRGDALSATAILLAHRSRA